MTEIRHETALDRHRTAGPSGPSLTGLIQPQEWTADALCAQIGGDEWFPEKGGSTKTARAICADCPVKQECLDYAIRNTERYGVWGGVGERDRRKLMRRQNKTETAA